MMNPIINRIGVKKIIRGSVMFSSTSNATITISPINPDNSIVILNDSLYSDGDCNNYGSRLISLTSTSITLSPLYYRYETVYNNTQYQYGEVTYQIIEFY